MNTIIFGCRTLLLTLFILAAGCAAAAKPPTTLAERVRDRLESETDITTHLLQIQADGPTITIEGDLSTLAERRRVLAAARDVPGVQDVQSDLRILARYRPDARIATSIREAMQASTIIDDRLPKVQVREGVATLRGNMNTWQMKRRAEDLAERTTGVKEVRNEISVAQRMQPLSDADMARKIEHTLARERRISAPLVDVTVRRGVAHLSGYVATEQERRLTITLAREAGARKVDADGLGLQEERSPSQAWIRITGRVGSAALRRRLLHSARAITAGRVIDGLDVIPFDPVSDSDLQRLIARSIADDPFLDREIEVLVNEGRVVLDGRVNNSFEAQRAENHAARLRGVEAVANKLQYDSTYYYRPDDELVDDLRGALLFSPFIDEDQVTVTARDGIITVRGTVRKDSEARRIVRKAFDAHAKDVRNELHTRSVEDGAPK